MIGQGQRDALWAGRTLAEAAGPWLDEPAVLDVALRRWERDRDAECLHAYHFGNIETRVQPVSPVLIEVLRRAGRSTAPDVGDVFGRTRSMPEVLTVPRLVRGLGDALRRGGSPRAATTREALGELRIHLAVRSELRGARFRSSRVVPGSDHPDPRPPAPPRRPAPPAVPRLEGVGA